MPSKRILVTGAAGFLGSHLCDQLLAEGNEVVGVDNYATGNAANLAHLSGETRFQFEQLDICRPFDPGPVDGVFNFASPASPVDYMRLGIETLLVGSAGTLNTLELAKKYRRGLPSCVHVRVLWRPRSTSPSGDLLGERESDRAALGV